MMRRRRSSRGQSTVEYLLVAVAVVLAIVFGLKQYIQPEAKARMTQAGAIVDKAGGEFRTSTGLE